MEHLWQYIEAEPQQVDALQKTLNINRVLCRLLVQRDVVDFDVAKAFFRPALNQLHAG